MCGKERKQASKAVDSSLILIKYLKENSQELIDEIVDNKLLKSKEVHNAKLADKDNYKNFKTCLLQSDFQWMIDYTELPNKKIINYFTDKYQMCKAPTKTLYLSYCDFYHYLDEYIDQEQFSYPEVKRKLKSLCAFLKKTCDKYHK